MKNLLISLILVTLCAVFPATAQTIDSDNGNTWRAIPGTLRTYSNANTRHKPQHDMLFQATIDGTPERVRYAVTDCPQRQGLIARIDSDGNAIGRILQWAADGNQVFDGIAVLICNAARADAARAKGERT